MTPDDTTTTEEPMPLDPDGDLLAALTPQQDAVAAWLGRGLSQKQIAGQLGCSERTIEAHIAAIGQKLAFSDCVCEVGDCTCPSPRRRAMVWAITRRFWRQVQAQHQRGAA